MREEPSRIDLRALDLELWGPEGPKGTRHLPPEEMGSDRWERARLLGFGEDTWVHHSSYVYGDIRVGSHTWIGPLAILDGSGGLEIGDHCMISARRASFSEREPSSMLSKRGLSRSRSGFQEKRLQPVRVAEHPVPGGSCSPTRTG